MGNLKRGRSPLAAAIGGLALLIWGVFLMTSGNATCGGQQMHQSDKCIVATGGGTTLESVGAQRGHNRAQGIIFVAIGGVLLAGGGYGTVRFVRSRRVAAAVTGQHIPEGQRH